MAEYSDREDFCTEFSQQPSVFAEHVQCRPPVHTLRHLLTHTAAGVPGTNLYYHPALYLKIPDLRTALVLLANSEGLWWDNPPDRAMIERSLFAQVFLGAVIDGPEIQESGQGSSD